MYSLLDNYRRSPTKKNAEKVIAYYERHPNNPAATGRLNEDDRLLFNRLIRPVNDPMHPSNRGFDGPTGAE